MLKRPRVIPVLSIINNDLVKTIQFKNPSYLGDPINAVKLFNGKFVDELIVLDIRSSINETPINYNLLSNIANQAFMPLAYGGGIKTFEEAKKLFSLGYEKLIFSSSLYERPSLIKEIVKHFGSQSVVASIDIKEFKKSMVVCIKSGTKIVSKTPLEYVKDVENLGVGEIMINFIDKEGKMEGYLLDVIQEISSNVRTPLIVNGGASSLLHLKEALDLGAHAVAATSMFVYYGKMKAILITFPSEEDLKKHKIYT